MKKLLVSSVIVLSAFFGSAQIEGGTIVTGGFASFNHRDYSAKGAESYTTLNIQPQFGFAFAENFVAGGWFSMSATKNFSAWSVSPFVRYYMKNFYAQGGYGFSYSKVADIDTKGSIIDFELGYAAFLNDNVALEPALYYNGIINEGNYYTTDIGIKLGFQIYLNR